ncbi:hydroxymethylglutaryl-CoA lyase [Mediterraneibacter glycyrrhizinilyticus]|nr:hydroxymethylglutaryl-CoA lyase [Mediterraneibacter glycyrrhizinilyticus]MBM6804381.1 hydroxymethylglutaryl-CoA lyase [Mediterraneibacter glycyrrhizinilyticus]
MQNKFPEKVTICEVVTRDGFQTAPEIYPVEEKVRIIEEVVDAGCRCVEVGAFSTYETMYKMKDTDKVFEQLHMKEGVEYRGLVYLPDDVRRAVACGCRKIKLNVSASNAHNQAGAGRSPLESMRTFAESGKIAEENGMGFAGSISLPFASQWEGVIPYEQIKEIVKAFIDAGATQISLSDSAGLGDPQLVYERTMALRDDFPEMDWMLHMHNTRGMGLANVVAAMEAGIDKIDTSLAGLGGCPYIKGATGNISTEDVLFMLDSMGIETGMDFEKIMEAGEKIIRLTKGVGTDSYQQRIRALAGNQ